MEITNRALEDYCRDHTTPLPGYFSELREETFAKAASPQMQVGLLEGSFLKLLVHLIQPKLVVEIGTFTGYSSLAMSEALPEGARIITCDIDPVATAMAKKYWERSPHGRQIELKLGPALETLRALHEPIDLAFIDADKTNYVNYWEALVPKMRKGGLIVADNVLWGGAVLDPQDENDHAICEFNAWARKDQRMEILMLPIRDGILLARKI